MKAAINQNNLIIPPTKLPDGLLSSAKTVDLTGYQGRSARVYLSASGQVEINPSTNSYWLIAEASLPPTATQQVQNSTRINTASAIQQAARSATGTTDTVTLAAGQRIGKIGYTWAPYQTGTDYTEASGVITWLTNGRQPKSGDSYQLEILTDTTVPVFDQQALQLDLTKSPVTLFDLPV